MRYTSEVNGTTPARGFTIIELMVITAIIGIVSALALVSLSESRRQGNDASIKSTLNGLASQAEIYYVNNGRYATTTISNSCAGGVFSDSVVSSAISNADKTNGAGLMRCYASASGYAVQSGRPSGAATSHWCVDSSNKRCGINANITGASCGTCISQN